MKKIRKRITIFIYLVLISFVVVLVRIGYVQIIKGDVYIERAFELWTRSIPVSAKRGRIFDRNGKLIVGNTIAPTISIIPKQVKDKEYTINTLSTLLKVPKEKLKTHFDKNVSVEIIKPEGRNISLEDAKKVIAADLDGVYISTDTFLSK